MNILMIPSGEGSLGNCDEHGPSQVRKYLDRFYTSESGQRKEYTFKEIKCPKNEFYAINNNIQESVRLQKDPFIALGGDHSITYPILKALHEKKRKEKKKIGFVVLDAHADLMDDFRPPSHEDYLRVLIEEKILDPEQVIIIGLRNVDIQEREYIKKHNLITFDMKRIAQEGIQEIMDNVTQTVNAWDGFYLSVDIDVIDPSFAPGTGYREPGGLSSREAIWMIQRLINSKKIIGGDLVEINKKNDIEDMSAILGAKILNEMSFFIE